MKKERTSLGWVGYRGRGSKRNSVGRRIETAQQSFEGNKGKVSGSECGSVDQPCRQLETRNELQVANGPKNDSQLKSRFSFGDGGVFILCMAMGTTRGLYWIVMIRKE